MKLLTYIKDENEQPSFGFKVNDFIVDIRKGAEWINQDQGNDKFLTIPNDLKTALEEWNHFFPILIEMQETVQNGDLSKFSNAESDLVILPPIINPPSFRDFYAFEQHVRAARRLRGLEMHPDWFKIAIFYFSNPIVAMGMVKKSLTLQIQLN